MTQIKTKSSHVASWHKVQDEIRKLVKDLPLEHRRVVQKTSEILTQLRPLERRKAWDLIRQRYKRGELDYPWLASFLVVLGRLKVEENAKP